MVRGGKLERVGMAVQARMEPVEVAVQARMEPAGMAGWTAEVLMLPPMIKSRSSRLVKRDLAPQ